jgi:hypothetical protein
MTLHVKNILEDKLWIVLNNGEKIGSIESVHDGVVFVKKDMSREKFNSINILSDKYNLVFDEDTNISNESDESFNVHGFPCESPPHNAVYDLSKKLPIFTKREKSTSFYSAGYFIIKFAHGWVRSYCPKLITLQRYEFRGPYKNKMEMAEALRRANNE